MKNHSTVTCSNSAPPHCQQRTPSGRRCRLPVSDRDSGLCFKHATSQKKARGLASHSLRPDAYLGNLAARLIGDTTEFTSAIPINRTLGEILKLLAEDEISPRRAAVMVYTCNLLLRTLPVIDRENGMDDEEHADNSGPVVIWDVCDPDGDVPEKKPA